LTVDGRLDLGRRRGRQGEHSSNDKTSASPQLRHRAFPFSICELATPAAGLKLPSSRRKPLPGLDYSWGAELCEQTFDWNAAGSVPLLAGDDRQP
jgi:hypothetical protein